MRNEAGYTATEALAALAIIGLAVGGLQTGIQTLGRSQDGVTRETAQSTATRNLDRRFNEFLAPYGPFRLGRSDLFEGRRNHLEFACGASRCSADLEQNGLFITSGSERRRIPAPTMRAPYFLYASDVAVADSWPWEPQLPQNERLRSVSIVDGVGGVATPIVVAKLWAQQEAACEFDSITRDCREKVGP